MKRLDEILSKNVSAVTSAESTEIPEPAADVCPRCGGAGFVRRERPLDHPSFGRAEPCDCVLSETVEVRRNRLERMSNLGALTRFTFQTLDPLGPAGTDPAFAGIAELARSYAREPEGWLVILGASGTGKTHIAAAVANDRIARGTAALFMVVPDLLDHLRASYDESGEDGYGPIFDQVRNAPFLVLDGLDAVSGTPWALEKLFQVVNHRYNTRLPTVFTCTSTASVEERLATRLSDPQLATVLRLDGQEVHEAYRQVGGMTRARLAEMQFATFDPRGMGVNDEERASLENAHRVAMRFAEAPRGWLLLQGENGCGKTHLAAAIANKVLAAGTPVFFAVVPDLLDHLRASFAPTNEVGYDELFEQVRDAALLVLDDLGAQATSPWAQEKLYQIVNYRTLGGLPTVITSDQGKDELRRAHPRIYSRIADPRLGVSVTILAPHYQLGPMEGRRQQPRAGGRERWPR